MHLTFYYFIILNHSVNSFLFRKTDDQQYYQHITHITRLYNLHYIRLKVHYRRMYLYGICFRSRPERFNAIVIV